MRYDGQGYDVTVALEPDWLDGGDFDADRAPPSTPRTARPMATPTRAARSG